MPASVVQTASTQDFGNLDLEASFSGAATSGNTLIACFGDPNVDGGSVGVGVSAVTDDDTPANSFTEDLSTNGDENSFWRLSDCGVVTTVNATADSAYTAGIFLIEAAGVDLSSPLQESEVWAALSGGAFQTPHTIPFTALEAGELVVGIVGVHAARTITGTNGTTAITNGSSRKHVVYKISSGAGADTLDFDLGSDGSAWGAVVSYSPAAGGASTGRFTFPLLGVG